MFLAAFRLNHHFVHPGDSLTNRLWLEKGHLNPEFHVKYVLENRELFITASIDKNYVDARAKEFPNLFN